MFKQYGVVTMHQRHKKILDLLQNGKICIPELATMFEVTEMTIRRDLRELEKQKLLIQVKNGALPYPVDYEHEYAGDGISGQKFSIAHTLYQRIMPSDTIFISTGTTALAFARILARQNVLPMTVITNALSVASALYRSSCKVILLGGELRTKMMDLVGPISEKNLEEYHVDWLISGCDGADADYGFYTSDSRLSSLEKKSICIADKVAIITEHTKFERRSLTRFASLQDIDLLVTDDSISDRIRTKLAQHGIEVLGAPQDFTQE